MNNFKKNVAEKVRKIAKNMAIFACGAASSYGGYQAKEPKNIYKK